MTSPAPRDFAVLRQEPVASVATERPLRAEAGETAGDGLERRTRLRALFGSAVGSAIEWYDYFLYGTMASLVFGPLFFPSRDPVSSQMLSLASFALAFLV